MRLLNFQDLSNIFYRAVKQEVRIGSRIFCRNREDDIDEEVCLIYNEVYDVINPLEIDVEVFSKREEL